MRHQCTPTKKMAVSKDGQFSVPARTWSPEPTCCGCSANGMATEKNWAASYRVKHTLTT